MKPPMHYLRFGRYVPHEMLAEDGTRTTQDAHYVTCRKCLIWMGAKS